MKIEIRVEGGPAIDRALADLGSKIAGRLGENAVRAGARVIASAAKAKAPQGATGALKASIRTFQDVERRAGSRTAFAGSRLFYAKFVEFGVPHAAAQPFLRPAADESKQEVRAKVAENLARGIERERLKGTR